MTPTAANHPRPAADMPENLKKNPSRPMGPQLPDAKGVYALILHLPTFQRLEIGRLGTFDFPPGYYAYIGSASGPGGLRARINYHLEADHTHPHWHIDYLTAYARPIEVWYALGSRRLESDWVDLFEADKGWRLWIPRFGASDYRRPRRSHLFYRRRPPSFDAFCHHHRRHLQPDIIPHRLVL